MTLIQRRTGLLLALGLTAMAAGPLAAQEVTLKAVNAFQEGTYYARNFERFVKKVNDEGKGIVQINYLGGPKAIPTMEQGAALRNGVVDLSNTTTSFVAGVSPESLALNYATDVDAIVKNVNGRFGSVADLGLKQAPFYVLVGARMTAVLVESSFITNRREEARLYDPKYHSTIADSVVEAVRYYGRKSAMAHADL